MSGDRMAEVIFGTAAHSPAARSVALGDLTFALDADGLRGVAWQGVEVVRGIFWPIRDPNWVTLIPDIVDETSEPTEHALSYRLVFTVGDGALHCTLDIHGSSQGTVTAELAMTAKADFATNRAGFTVLHPIRGVAGVPLTVHHSDGSIEATRFPEYISPGQPALDIVGLAYAVDGVTVDIGFTGDVFEMEDQRNWSDASYKTYCHPLVLPFTYTIKAGETLRQSVVVNVSGEPKAGAAASGGADIALGAAAGVFPDIGLALESGWLSQTDAMTVVSRTGIRLLQVRTGPRHDPAFLSAAAALARDLDAEIEAEIVVPEEGDTSAALAAARSALATAGLVPKRVMVLPERYLASYQPSGPWPEGDDPNSMARAARAVLTDVEIGGGVLTNFTEFNRCRPDTDVCDYITHGTTAIVHAADDRSVIETLEALPQIHASAEALGGGKPYRLGLVSIGMRSNPYGAAVAPNPDQIRQSMAMDEPRQRGLFAAAWAVGALAATEGSAVRSLSLGAPGGPFALVSSPQAVPRPIYDQASDAIVYPLFHVARAAAGLSGQERLTVAGLPAEVHGFAGRDGGAVRLVLANLGASDVALRLPDAHAQYRVLNGDTFDGAIRDADWLDGSPAVIGQEVVLAPFAVAFVDLDGARG
ncbi:MAG: hypothetical protein GY798_16615 [Hyphomicrobiales bacterium]|nr:hypothetical protein [Hyphomicrobiales bacterium]